MQESAPARCSACPSGCSANEKVPTSDVKVLPTRCSSDVVLVLVLVNTADDVRWRHSPSSPKLWRATPLCPAELLGDGVP